MLKERFGDVDWQVIHDAAITPVAGQSLAGCPNGASLSWWSPIRAKNVGGLAAMVAAAGEYYDSVAIGTVFEVTDPGFPAVAG